MDIYFAEFNKTRGWGFYLFAFSLKIPQLIFVALLKYTNLHITNLKKFD
jgi:hypothetical protein